MNRKGIWQWPLRVISFLAIVMSLVAMLSACTDSATNDLSPGDSNVYFTNYDRQADFNQYKTFSLPDSVLVESNDRFAQSAQPVEQQVVTRVAAELTSRGFTRLAAGQRADLGVVVTRVNNRYTGVGVNPYAGYWGNYWGGGFGWGGGFNDPFFFPTYYEYQVSDRSWRIDMVDLKNQPAATTSPNPNDPNNQLRVIYSAQIRGGDIFNSATINQIIADVFNQSPYLRTTR
jgi:hypothetical protein